MLPPNKVIARQKIITKYLYYFLRYTCLSTMSTNEHNYPNRNWYQVCTDKSSHYKLTSFLEGEFNSCGGIRNYNLLLKTNCRKSLHMPQNNVSWHWLCMLLAIIFQYKISIMSACKLSNNELTLEFLQARFNNLVSIL